MLKTFILMIAIVMLTPNSKANDVLSAEFDLALKEHLELHFESMAGKLAGKLGLTGTEFKTALQRTPSGRGFDLKGHLKSPQGLCEIEGKIDLFEKSLRALCLDERRQLKIIF
jgi:hypothetical protein